MQNKLVPTVGQWYAHCDKGEMFRVVAVDTANGSIEIQSFGGDIEAIDRDVWLDMDVEAAEAPEDWTGPFDDLERDDIDPTQTVSAAPDWRRSVESIDAANEPWVDSMPLE